MIYRKNLEGLGRRTQITVFLSYLEKVYSYLLKITNPDSVEAKLRHKIEAEILQSREASLQFSDRYFDVEMHGDILQIMKTFTSDETWMSKGNYQQHLVNNLVNRVPKDILGKVYDEVARNEAHLKQYKLMWHLIH